MISGVAYTRDKILKHDFFAVTTLYRQLEPRNEFLTFYEQRSSLSSNPPRKAVLKIGRTADLLGLPMRPFGAWLARREAWHYERLQGLPGVPRFLGTWGENGLIHEYVEGHPLARGEWVNDDFFPALATLLGELHARGIAYVDLQKRENVLVGDDGRPYLIDFQISFTRPRGWLGRTWALRRFLQLLQESDRYHLLKHRRRHRPDQLTPEELEAAQHKPAYLDLYGLLTRPFTKLRRRTLQRLYTRPDAPEIISDGGSTAWRPTSDSNTASGGADD
jgi:hypothetical protein